MIQPVSSWCWHLIFSLSCCFLLQLVCQLSIVLWWLILWSWYRLMPSFSSWQSVRTSSKEAAMGRCENCQGDACFIQYRWNNLNLFLQDSGSLDTVHQKKLWLPIKTCHFSAICVFLKFERNFRPFCAKLICTSCMNVVFLIGSYVSSPDARHFSENWEHITNCSRCRMYPHHEL